MNPPEGMHKLPTDDEYWTDMAELIQRVNGFVYHGHRTDAVIDTIKALRADPDLQHRLLGNTND